MSGPLLTTNPSPSLFAILSRIPNVLLWNYLNLLVFNVANQRMLESLLEDSVNKAWRPLPSRRLSLAQARRFLLFLIPFVFGITILFLGAVKETVLLMALTWMYNDLFGAEEHYAVRNIINAAGFMCYSSGSTRIAAGYGVLSLNGFMSNEWSWIVGAIVFTTLQMQDMSDQEGDSKRNRSTVPLIWGDMIARWTIAVPVLIWSFFCARFWHVDILGYLSPVVLGSILAGRVLVLRRADQDKITWKLWCVWTLVLYSLPLYKNHDVLSRAWCELEFFR